MSTTKYIHVRNGTEGTIALEPPTKDYLQLLFKTHSTSALINLGVTKLHPNDNFVKRIGREKSKARMAYLIGNFERIEIVNTRHVYHLTFNNLNTEHITKCKLVLATTAECENVLVLDGDIYETT